MHVTSPYYIKLYLQTAQHHPCKQSLERNFCLLFFSVFCSLLTFFMTLCDKGPVHTWCVTPCHWFFRISYRLLLFSRIFPGFYYFYFYIFVARPYNKCHKTEKRKDIKLTSTQRKFKLSFETKVYSKLQTVKFNTQCFEKYVF
jgi:hypothetical protein